MASPHTPSRTVRSPLGLVIGATVLAALVAFVVGRFSADAAPPQSEGRGARAEAARAAEPGWTSEPTRRVELRRAQPGQEAPAAPAEPPAPAVALAAPLAPLVPPGQSSPAVVAATARASEETLQQLQAAKHELVQKCWPAKGLPGGRSTARLTFSVAYDAHGREVGRAVGEPRGAPTGELRKCVSRQMSGALRVSPPGAGVSVRVSMLLP